MKITEIINLKISAEQSIKVYNRRILFMIKEAAVDYFDEHTEIPDNKIKDVFDWFKSFEDSPESLYYSLLRLADSEDEHLIVYKQGRESLVEHSFNIQTSILKGILDKIKLAEKR